MRYRIQHQSKWYKTLTFAKARAIELQRRSGKTVHLVDEAGAVVWSTPKLTASIKDTTEASTTQGDLF